MFSGPWNGAQNRRAERFFEGRKTCRKADVDRIDENIAEDRRQIIGETRLGGACAARDAIIRRQGTAFTSRVRKMPILSKYSVRRRFARILYCPGTRVRLLAADYRAGASQYEARFVHTLVFTDRGPYSDARRILGQRNVPNNTF